MADVEQLLRLGIQMIQIHPPHQLLFPNDYLNGVNELEIIYRAAEANGIPVMFHTGTSIFPGARTGERRLMVFNEKLFALSTSKSISGIRKPSPATRSVISKTLSPRTMPVRSSSKRQIFI